MLLISETAHTKRRRACLDLEQDADGTPKRKLFIRAFRSDDRPKLRIIIGIGRTTGAAALAEVDDHVIALGNEGSGVAVPGHDALLARRVVPARRLVLALAYRRHRPGAYAALVAARPPLPGRVSAFFLLVRCGNQILSRANASFLVILFCKRRNKKGLTFAEWQSYEDGEDSHCDEQNLGPHA